MMSGSPTAVGATMTTVVVVAVVVVVVAVATTTATEIMIGTVIAIAGTMTAIGGTMNAEECEHQKARKGLIGSGLSGILSLARVCRVLLSFS
jgi:cobalamin biosynthesis protein CobD/CbiB